MAARSQSHVRGGFLLLLLSSSLLVGCVQPRAGRRPADAPVGRVAAAAGDFAIGGEERSEEEDGDGFAEDALRPCPAASPEMAATRNAIGQLSSKIAALSNNASTTEITEELAALLATPCLALAKADLGDELPELQSALALKSWWHEGGGAAWIQQYGDVGAAPGDPRGQSMSIPAMPRHSLFLESKSRPQPLLNALAPLLCPASDADAGAGTGCGRETVGWMRRAESALSRNSKPEDDEKKDESCVAEAMTKPSTARYGALRTCRQDAAHVRDALPLGRFKAPTDGLFVIESRGGCEDIAIYDLATGTTWKVDCASSHHHHHPSSTQTATPTLPTVTVGHVPVAALREVVWMFALSRVKQTDFRPIDSFHVPKGITIGRPHGDSDGWLSGLSLYGSSRHRIWTWMRPVKRAAMKMTKMSAVYTGQISGHFDDMPPNAVNAEAHAIELLDIVDDGFVAGCGAAATPAFVPSAVAIEWDKPGPTLDEHIAVDFDRPESEPGHRAFLAAKPAPRCTGPGQP